MKDESARRTNVTTTCPPTTETKYRVRYLFPDPAGLFLMESRGRQHQPAAPKSGWFAGPFAASHR